MSPSGRLGNPCCESGAASGTFVRLSSRRDEGVGVDRLFRPGVLSPALEPSSLTGLTAPFTSIDLDSGIGVVALDVGFSPVPLMALVV